MQIRILPSVKTQTTVNIAINGARRDLPVGQIVTVSDEELRIISDRGIDYTYGDTILPDANLIAAIASLTAQVAFLQQEINSGGVVVVPPVATTLTLTGSFPAGVIGADYDFTPTVAGGTGTKTFAYTGDSLAAHGLTFDTATGRIH